VPRPSPAFGTIDFDALALAEVLDAEMDTEAWVTVGVPV